jgi:hypothetical protein
LSSSARSIIDSVTKIISIAGDHRRLFSGSDTRVALEKKDEKVSSLSIFVEDKSWVMLLSFCTGRGEFGIKSDMKQDVC